MSCINNILPTLLLLTTGLALLINNPASCDPYPWAENVCNKSIPIKKDIVIKYPVQYEIKVQSMCGILSCEKVRKETRIDEKITSVVQFVDRPTCCQGYAETPDKRCAPICLQSCNNGKCVSPNVCKCQPEPTSATPGFVGPTCGRFVCLNSDKWGAKCDRDCNCSGNSYCGADTGKCLCHPGWRGTNCTIECDPDSEDYDCEGNNKLPPIIEPDANLVNEQYSGMLRHKPEALVLNDDVKIITDENQHDWNNLTSSYLIGVLSVVCMGLFVAFLVIKRRYEYIRNELYYSAAASSDGSSGSNRSGGSSLYSSFYTMGRSPSSLASGGGGQVGANLEKNLSFAAATRNILLGKNINSLQAKDIDRNKMVLHPRVESSLIKSQKQAEQNVYTDIVLNMKDGSGGRKDKSVLPAPPSDNNYSSDDNVYQVPKSVSAPNDTTTRAVNENSDGANEIYDDSSSNIYEELKPRT